MRTPITDLDCIETVDAVFDREGFAAAPNVSGPNRLYTPRASTVNSLALQWGIAVNVANSDRGSDRNQCTFEMQALSTDEDCGITCPLTPHPGFDDVTRKMAGLLAAAFRGRSEK